MLRGIHRNRAGIRIAHGISRPSSVAGIGLTPMKDIGIVNGETPRSHLEGNRACRHVRRHFDSETQKVVFAGRNLVHLRISLMAAGNDLHAPIGEISIINGKPHSTHVRSLNRVPVGVVLMPGHRETITGTLGDHMGHDEDQVWSQNRFNRIKDPGVPAEFQP